MVTQNLEDDEDEDQVCSYREEDDDVEEEDVDGLCEGMRKMSFAGKHTRFVYGTEDEDIVEANEQSPPVLLLPNMSDFDLVRID